MLKSKAPQLKIRTAEGVVFAMTLAGPLCRMYAWFLDVCFIILLVLVISMVVQLFTVISTDLATAGVIAVQFVIPILYGMVSEYFWAGQTIGKRLMRLKVVDAHGLRLHFSQVGIRNLLRVVDALPIFYAVGGICSFLSPKAQRLGDIAANTVVIRVPRILQPDLEKIGPTKFNSLRDYPHLAGRLRKLVSPIQASVALQALVRRDEFQPAERIKLFQELSVYFKRLVAFPEEAVEGVSDEQYVRNVVEVLYRRSGNLEEKPKAELAA